MLEDKKAIFESMRKKLVKMFLVCNAIMEKFRKSREKRGS